MLNRSAGVEFVGLYASFPVDEPTRRVGILKAILDLEGEPEFKRIKYGQLLGRLHTVTFSEEKLGDVLRSLETGESDYLQLFPYRVGEDWVQSFKASISVNFQSGISRPHKRAPSPIDSKFGDAGTVNVLYPQPRFVFDSESDFQTRLLRKIKELFVMEKMNWAFVNRGFHFIHPTSVGTDDIFQTTKVGFPITAFDADLNSHGIFFREFVKGAFWANFLNPLHVAKLGGLDLVKGSKACSVIQELEGGRVLLQVGPSPLTRDEAKATGEYQRLRTYLQPILMETGSDLMRIQREILGSWRPPRDAEENFKKLMGEMKRKAD